MVDQDNATEARTAPAEGSAEWVDFIVTGIIRFAEVLADREFRPYQLPFAYRYVESVITEDTADITALFSRQSGKSETVCNVTAALMVLLPRLARLYPNRLGKFKNGVYVGMFAPVEDQADTLFGRLVDRLTSDHGMEILQDPEIDDFAKGSSKQVRLKRCGSYALKMTANPKARIESKTFHIVVIDEAQDCDDFVISKSIMPMMAATAGTSVLTGTPTTHKGYFFEQIRQNKRDALSKRGAKPNHFEADWKTVALYSPEYKKFVSKELDKKGEDSDEFQMSYCLKWLLDRGMFTTETRMDELGDITVQELIKAWQRTPVVVGIDPAKTIDSTVVTVVWVDWDRPDEFGLYRHRVLNWLELEPGIPLEQQYPRIVEFLEPYSIFAVAVDNQGMGMAVTERLAVLLRHKNCTVVPMNSNPTDQNKRWKHLTTLMDKSFIAWPAGARVRRLRTWKRFHQQMVDAEKHYQGPNLMIKAPDENGAHDDYVDSLALATYLTAELSVPEAEMVEAPWYR